jgi:iron(III) transport system ATP-binding protein
LQAESSLSPAVPPGKPFITVSALVAGYGRKVAVDNVSFEVMGGEHLSLLGPSGCGKSTTLRCIAGLETPLEGEISIGGNLVFSSKNRVNLPPEKRNLAMVFQSYAIWPHMTVFENVAYGVRIRGPRGAQLDERVLEALEMVGMREFADRQATELSGGQQQRVALARSYAVRPQAILLDEPLSNLDARLRSRMCEELKDLQRKTHVSTIYVTHDQQEAMAISNRIIVMREGKIEQSGSPLDIYDRPRSRFVADFIGAANVLQAEVIGTDGPGRTQLRTGATEIISQMAPAAVPGGAAARAESAQPIIVRTVYAKLQQQPFATTENVWPATIIRRVLLGDIVSYLVRWPGGELRVNDFPALILEEGAQVFLHIPAERVVMVEA